MVAVTVIVAAEVIVTVIVAFHTAILAQAQL